jgi:hypothetical protein
MPNSFLKVGWERVWSTGQLGFRGGLFLFDRLGAEFNDVVLPVDFWVVFFQPGVSQVDGGIVAEFDNLELDHLRVILILDPKVCGIAYRSSRIKGGISVSDWYWLF